MDILDFGKRLRYCSDIFEFWFRFGLGTFSVRIIDWRTGLDSIFFGYCLV